MARASVRVGGKQTRVKPNQTSGNLRFPKVSHAKPRKSSR